MNKKIALSVPVLLGVGSAFAEGEAASGMTTYTNAGDAIAAISTTATTAFNTFATSIVPLLLGALVLVGGLTLGKWIIKKIRP